MNKSVLAVTACAALTAAFATPAVAQVTGVFTKVEADLQFKPKTGGGSYFDPVKGKIIEGNFGSQTFGSGGSFASTSISSPDYIYFKNGNAASGIQISSVSTTLVDITFRNNGDKPVVPKLQSQIVPAGFGIFVGGSGCPNDPTQCNPDDPLTGQQPRNFQSFLRQEPVGKVLASASFEFRIFADGFTAYELTGALSLVVDQTQQGVRFVKVSESIDDAQGALKGWTRLSDPGSQDFIGFQWDTTDILVDFPPQVELAVGESATLTYETIVRSNSFANCFGGSRPACLVSYSAFGDPLGRSGGGGGSELGALMASASSFSALANPLAGIGNDPDGILFRQSRFLLPQFNNGTLTYQLDPTYIDEVPEPDSWALMIAGFGLVGATMRRQRRLAA